jgi:hypothetical protein
LLYYGLVTEYAYPGLAGEYTLPVPLLYDGETDEPL